MPKVSFSHDKIDIEVPVGTTLQVAVELAKTSLPFGCRMGSCGTCRCIVVAGSENLSALTEAEIELFENLTSVGKNERLACQLIIRGDVIIQS